MSNIRRCKNEFRRLVRVAVRAGILTVPEAYIIAGNNGHKAWAVCSRLAKLRRILAERYDARINDDTKSKTKP